MQRILTIIITYNGLKWIEKCISSVINSTVHSDILVVDNGSNDGTQEYILSAFPSIRFIQNADNQGFGAANNIGLKIAIDENYNYAYLLNQDAYLLPNTIERLLRYARNDKNNPVIAKECNDCGNLRKQGVVHAVNYGILSPLQLTADGTLDHQFTKKCGRYLKKSDSEIVEVPFVMAAHWLMTREAILTVGGFSPTFHQYGEDDNYLHRLRYHGFKCAIVPNSRAIHDRSKRTNPKERRMKLKCVATIVKASNPSNFFGVQVSLEVIELIGMSIKNLSITPLKFIPILIQKLPEIKRNRQKSLEKAAFLL